jgi:hypothetical protein
MFLTSAKRQFLTGLIGMSLLLLGGWYAFKHVSENGLSGLFPSSTPSPVSVRLKPQAVYEVKTKQQLLGVDVIRIISKRQPEEFLVLNHVPTALVNSMYGKQVNLAWANTVASQFMKLRQSTETDASPISVDIQDVKTLKSGKLKQKAQELPYWQIEIRFKLSNEPQSRYYNAGVIRQPDRSESNSTEALVVGYAQKEAYQPELVADLLEHLNFEQN